MFVRQMKGQAGWKRRGVDARIIELKAWALRQPKIGAGCCSGSRLLPWQLHTRTGLVVTRAIHRHFLTAGVKDLNCVFEECPVLWKGLQQWELCVFGDCREYCVLYTICFICMLYMLCTATVEPVGSKMQKHFWLRKLFAAFLWYSFGVKTRQLLATPH